MRSRSVTGRGWVAFGLATAAVLYSVAFGAVLLSLANDARVVALAGLMLPVAALMAWYLLHRKCAGRPAGDGAWVIVLVLLFFSFITGFSIGLYVFPAALLLAGSAFLVDQS
jgi:hypothetical protein